LANLAGESKDMKTNINPNARLSMYRMNSANAGSPKQKGKVK